MCFTLLCSTTNLSQTKAASWYNQNGSGISRLILRTYRTHLESQVVNEIVLKRPQRPQLSKGWWYVAVILKYMVVRIEHTS
jgi:hypothetical protein